MLVLLLHQFSSSLRAVESASGLRPRRPPGGGDEADLVALGRRVAGGGQRLVLCFLRAEQREEAVNFLAHVNTSGVGRLFLGVALDGPAASLLKAFGAAVHQLAPAPLDARALAAARWRYLAALTGAGIAVWVSDVRVLWRRRPLNAGPPATGRNADPPPRAPRASEWAPSGECDLMLASAAPDGRRLVVPGALRADGSREPPTSRTPSPSLALGFHDAVPSVTRWQLRMARWILEEGPGGPVYLHEETLLARALVCDDEDRARGGASCLRWCVLPPDFFPNGLQFFQQRLPQLREPPVQPVAVILDWTPRGRLRTRLLDEGLWRVGSPEADAEGALARGERFLAYKELVINNGLSNSRSALRSALAIAELTNRSLILPPFWSTHLRGDPHRVGADYYFNVEALRRNFPRVRETSFLRRAFPDATAWPPKPSVRVHFVQLHPDESLCEERTDSAALEALGTMNATCPSLRLPAGQLRSIRATKYHLGASETELAKWLAPLAHEPLLYFGRMFRRFGRFSSPRMHEAFRARYAAAVQPAPEIRAVAEEALRALRALGGGSGAFDCVHMRRRDFVADHAAEERGVDEYAALSAERLHAVSTGTDAPAAMLYLASDVADELGVREAFRRATGRRVITLADVFPPWELDTFGATEHSAGGIGGPSTANAALARDMRFGNVDQHVCAEARFFAGNVFSSFTHHVCYLRVLRGVPAACVGSDVYGREADPRTEWV